MLHLLDYLKTQPHSRWPRRILFESNELAAPAQVELVKTLFVNSGYRLVRSDYDTVLELT
jgi:hypothetical protein